MMLITVLFFLNELKKPFLFFKLVAHTVGNRSLVLSKFICLYEIRKYVN